MDWTSYPYEAEPPGIVGPDILEIISEFISLLCITLLAYIIGNKTYSETTRTMNYGKFMVIMLYVTSWSFAFTSAVVVSTNNNNMVSCTLAMLSCDIFYAGSKIVIYAWLIERIFLVKAIKQPRLSTWQYRIHLTMLCPYIIIFALMLTYRNIYLEADGKCTIGLQLIASVPLLVYDSILNFYLTLLFMLPLMSIGLNSKANWKKSKLYRLAQRTLVASIVSLIISFANVLVVVITRGHERGLVCLTMCTVDVTVNAITIYWVTTHRVTGNNMDAHARSKTFYTMDQVSAELSFNATAPGVSTTKNMNKDRPKYEFDTMKMDYDDDIRSPTEQHHDENDSCGEESIRSTQVSQISAKPLHNY
ncbi:hypothetical protein BDF20DRAFT_911489 [Mycotypha africana]|uniref:uncharacterized protein n=1 Tax=Mycotypha africana TaxID=64632 RepID=UPI0022FFF80F|nr:uncharacterized protein BDF20DRAFT_911489 [Mycotypha africana]KAI8984387.1 hypothetical protein BDF20DRAFT_911489 [Mycotypha africana]